MENIGPGIAVNVRYEFAPISLVVQARPSGYVADIPHGGEFQLPVATGTIAGYEFMCILSYKSASHRKYRTSTMLNDLVITDIRLESEPEQHTTGSAASHPEHN